MERRSRRFYGISAPCGYRAGTPQAGPAYWDDEKNAWKLVDRQINRHSYWDYKSDELKVEGRLNWFIKKVGVCDHSPLTCF